jgi:hypothetical protein
MRVYDIVLECGCMLSADGGGGLIPCSYGYGCAKKKCVHGHLCKNCLRQEKFCSETWKKFFKSKKYKKHLKEVKERN